MKVGTVGNDEVLIGALKRGSLTAENMSLHATHVELSREHIADIFVTKGIAAVVFDGGRCVDAETTDRRHPIAGKNEFAGCSRVLFRIRAALDEVHHGVALPTAVVWVVVKR